MATQQDLHAFLCLGWKGPHNWDTRTRPASALFDARARVQNREHDGIKCSASECLGMYVLVRHYVECVMPNHVGLDAHKTCFLLLCRAVDLFMRVKRGLLLPAAASSRLRAVLAQHLQKHKELYGDEHIKPKNHWLFDCADFLERDTFLFDAFVIERLHLRARRVADSACGQRKFEVTVLNGLVNSQCHALREEGRLRSPLLGQTVPLPGVPGGQLGRRLEARGTHLSVDDVVRLGEVFGSVRACVSEDGNCFVLVDEHPTLRILTETCVVCSIADGPRSLWRALEVELCSAWRHADGGVNLVILHT